MRKYLQEFLYSCRLPLSLSTEVIDEQKNFISNGLCTAAYRSFYGKL